MDERPGPGRRRGPRPLMMHLALAALSLPKTISPGSNAASPTWNADWMSFLAQLHGSDVPESPLPPPVDRDFIAGIAAYRRHPYVRDVTDPPAVWSRGSTSLLDYGGSGPAMLLVPSLVNRFTVLDLSSDRSMARFLAAQGFHVLLLDWGWPGAAEAELDLDALVTRRLLPVIEGLGAVILVGYCMGGLLTLAAALHAPQVRALALLATPWDFHAGDAETVAGGRQLYDRLAPLIAQQGGLSVDVLQALFSLGDPASVAAKYRAFAATEQDSDRARQFVALEDWLNDGVPLTASVAEDCLQGWYGENRPMTGCWTVAGTPVDPAGIRVPSFVAIPSRDRIVPPESAEPLARLIPGARAHRPLAGHVGMVAGRDAAKALWRPLAEWATQAERK